MVSAESWAEFLIKLGSSLTKKYIVDYISTHQLSDDKAWDYFVESHSLVKKTANVNHFYNSDDVNSYFLSKSYAQMRNTFPRRSHGWSIFGRRFKTMQEVIEETKKDIIENNQTVEINIPDNLSGKYLVHNTFGKGIITEQKTNGVIIVNFDEVGEKSLDYLTCIKNEFIVLDEHRI